MAENDSYKILVIESKDGLREKICSILTSMGHEVESSNSFDSALSMIDSSASSPYALIISCYRMPGMNGDEILKKARELYPDSPRILIADASDLYSIVTAINTAGIHSCLSVPFMDADFISHIKKGIDKFAAIKKFKNLRSVSERQNKQMFLAASNFKKKEKNNVAQIKEKEKK
jgi:DNA-binding NtrC family response regulator